MCLLSGDSVTCHLKKFEFWCEFTIRVPLENLRSSKTQQRQNPMWMASLSNTILRPCQRRKREEGRSFLISAAMKLQLQQLKSLIKKRTKKGKTKMKRMTMLNLTSPLQQTVSPPLLSTMVALVMQRHRRRRRRL